jgi:hypothetical protein
MIGMRIIIRSQSFGKAIAAALADLVIWIERKVHASDPSHEEKGAIIAFLTLLFTTLPALD